MSASHGCNDDRDVVESFKEALIGRVGADRYQMWFSHGVEFAVGADIEEPSADPNVTAESAVDDRVVLQLRVHGQFALDRLRKNFLREIRGAAMQAGGEKMDVQLSLDGLPAEQGELPLGDPSLSSDTPAKGGKAGSTSKRARRTKPSTEKRGRGKTTSLSSLISQGGIARRPEASHSDPSAHQLTLPHLESADPAPQRRSAKPADGRSTSDLMTAETFVQGPSNQLAHTALVMVCQNPAAASPLFICGPTGTGKTHIMTAIADQLRRRHRMRRVMHLSAEQFTNDFISSVGSQGITAFRRRYREVDALLIDDVQFLGAKKATLRELLYTVETLAGEKRPLVFSGLQSPTEIPGLSRELAGRMAAGLVCPLQPLDMATREVVLRRWISQRCQWMIPDQMIEQLTPIMAGDGRVISGIVNMINTLQRMYQRIPTMDELRQFGGQLLRASKPIATLSVIEAAVCDAFQLSHDTLRGGSQIRAVTEPRMLAMYLSRQLTSSAYAEIARHFGGKSHSTAISAENNVKGWLENGKSIGRGHTAMSAREAIDRVERLLRSG